MTSPATAEAPANIAWVKYWGMLDAGATLPAAPSISMTLCECATRTTVELLPESAAADEVLWSEREGELEPAAEAFAAPVRAHLDRLRQLADRTAPCRVATRNSFPSAAGLASSASGFAALTMAAAAALELETTLEDLSVLARESGSGSAARSLYGGFVEWPGGEDPAGPARQLLLPEHWPLCDVIAIVGSEGKSVSSRQGHERAPTSALFRDRLRSLPGRLESVRQAIRERSLVDLGSLIEAEAAEMHAIALSSQPPIVYWNAGTLAILRAVAEWRRHDLPVFWTIDAGANVHLICEPGAEGEVAARVHAVPEVSRVIRDRIGEGARLTEEHLL